MRSWLLLAAILPSTALASEHEVSLGATAVLLTNGGVYNVTTPRPAVEAAYAYGRDVWRVGGGLRWAPGGGGPLPVELYARLLLSPATGTWRPAVGPELGYSGLPIIVPPPGGLPDDLAQQQAGKLAPFYVAVHAQPLRFVFGAFTVSALELQWGTPLNQPGAALRLQLGLLQIGVVR